MKTLVINTQTAVGNALLRGITTHTGIVDDKDDLLILEPLTDHELSETQCTRILIELAKLSGKEFVSFQPVLVDLNFNQTGKLMILREHFDPYPCRGEVIRCAPNDKLIEHVKNKYK